MNHTPSPSPTQPAQFDMKALYGLTEPADEQWAGHLLTHLSSGDEALIPWGASHPFLSQIVAGLDGVAPLLERLEASPNAPAADGYDALDALAYIFAALTEGAPPQACERLKKCLSQQTDLTYRTEILKVLAVGRDPATLCAQVARLGDADPGIVASAARLLGLGRCEQAVLPLIALVSPERAFEAPQVLWALGEIGSPLALTVLHAALSNSFWCGATLVALGKIGHAASIDAILPHLYVKSSRDAASGALAHILHRCRAQDPLNPETSDRLRHLFNGLLQSAEDDVPASTRFHWLLCLARCGGTLPPALISHCLNVPLDSAKVGNLASFFANRKIQRAQRPKEWRR